MSLPLALIAAVARNRVIGLGNALPWRLAGDMKHFRALTMGKPVLMGRRTWESIGRPLPGRFVIVLTRDAGFRADGVALAADAEDAIACAEAIAAREGAGEAMVAGGGTLYGELIARARTLYLTEVDLAPDGDTLFPPVDPATWREVARQTQAKAPGEDADYAFVTYHRT